MQSCSQYCFRCIKVRRQRYQKQQQRKRYSGQFRSTKKEKYHHHNNTDISKDNQKGFTVDGKFNKGYKQKFNF